MIPMVAIYALRPWSSPADAIWPILVTVLSLWAVYKLAPSPPPPPTPPGPGPVDWHPTLMGTRLGTFNPYPYFSERYRSHLAPEHPSLVAWSGTIPEATPVVDDSLQPIFFRDGEPTLLVEFGAQHHVIELLEKTLASLEPDVNSLDPQLFMGPAGGGKTLLAKIVAHELQLRALRLGLPIPSFFEVFPADLDTVESLDAVIRRAALAPAAVIFIDEVHGLTGTHSHKLYELLANQRYAFRDDPTPTLLPNVTLLAATTDYGALHPALQRRWIRHYFEAATERELLAFIERRPFPIERQASQAIVQVTKQSGQPWEAIELYRLATVSAKARNAPLIEARDVEWVIAHQGIDALGLRRMDRQVLQALLGRARVLRSGETVYGASEQDTCALARVDKQEFRETIRPRLMARGLLTMRAGVGQALTPKALTLYGDLDDVAPAP